MVPVIPSYKTGPLDMSIGTNTPNTVPWPFVAVMMVLGLGFVAGGIFMNRSVRRLAKIARVQGEITDVKGEWTRAGKAFYPVVAFRTLDGADVQTLIHQPKFWSRSQIGTRVTVVYDPAKPATAYIYSDGIRYGGIVYIAVGLGVLALAIAAIVAANQPI